MAKYYGEEHTKTLCKRIEKMGAKHGVHRVFEDFLEVSAISISNVCDWTNRDEREKRYLDIVRNYNTEELQSFADMMNDLVNAMQSCVPHPTDILGQVFHRLELHNKYNGQFFTPQHLCDCMGAMSFSKDDKLLAQKGYLSVCEPAAGSGAMILGIAHAMSDEGCNYSKQMVVEATDIDIKCVHMTYIQLSLYGIPAVVIHGNSLTAQEWSKWYTTVYMLDGWPLRKMIGSVKKTVSDMTDNKKTASVDCNTSGELPHTPDIELTVNQSGQMSLF